MRFPLKEFCWLKYYLMFPLSCWLGQIHASSHLVQRHPIAACGASPFRVAHRKDSSLAHHQDSSLGVARRPVHSVSRVAEIHRCASRVAKVHGCVSRVAKIRRCVSRVAKIRRCVPRVAKIHRCVSRVAQIHRCVSPITKIHRYACALRRSDVACRSSQDPSLRVAEVSPLRVAR